MDNDEEDELYFDDFAHTLNQCKEQAAKDADLLLSPTKRSRAFKKAVSFVTRDKDGISIQMNARNSSWWLNYIESPQLENLRFLNAFHRRFRLPYMQFKELVADAKTCPERVL